MNIAIPVDDKNIKSNVCISFGRAPYFMIYNTDKEDSIYIKNTTADSAGGAGIKAAQLIVDNKVDCLLTPRCGENAANVIKAANIKIYKTNDSSVIDNINAFIRGELSLLDEIHAGFHNHGGK